MLPEIHIINSDEIKHFQCNKFQASQALNSLCFSSHFPLLQPKGARLERIHPWLVWLEAPGPAELLEMFLPLEYRKQLQVTLPMPPTPPTLRDAP